jgi:hypothetical protein
MKENTDLELKEYPTEFGLASFRLGLGGILMLFMTNYSFLLSIWGLVFGIIQLKIVETKLGLAGFVLSVLGLLSAIVIFLINIVLFTLNI